MLLGFTGVEMASQSEPFAEQNTKKKDSSPQG